jgi:branched-chain amino acid transport system substrate-binding protein
MRDFLVRFSGLVAALLIGSAAEAQQTLKIGVILPYSGQLADPSAQLDNGIKLYMKQHGDVVAGRKIEVIRRDTGGIAPDVAKRLAQELVVRDGVDILAGMMTTPNALAVSDVAEQAKKFMVIMNAATSIITTKSQYSVRVSMTIPQVADALGSWAYKNGVRKAYTMVSDYGPGHDAEDAFSRSFKAAGGEIVGGVRMPVSNPDFTAFVQRAKDLNPESIMVFVPAGVQPAALGKSFAERGVDPSKIKIFGTGEVTDESAVKSMGEASLGIITAWHYDYNLQSKINQDFVKAYNEMAPGPKPSFASAGGYDGMHVIYEALKKTGGKSDAGEMVAAAKGLSWTSPRGPMKIDPETRDVVQTIYIRKVEKIGGNLVNVDFDKVENVKDPVKARMAK